MGTEYVVMGATLKCTMGLTTSKLMIAPPHRELLKGKIMANMMDFKPMTNILPFGSCNVTAPPKPCTPACAPWMGCKANALLEGQPALLKSCTTVCAAGGGMVSITDSGQ